MRLPLVLLTLLAALASARGDLASQIALAEEARDTHATIELLRRWLDVHPNDQEALQRQALLWLEVPDFDRAAHLLPGISDPGFVARAKADIARRQGGSLPAALEILRARWASAPEDAATGRQLSRDLLAASLSGEQVAVLDALIARKADAGLLLDRADAKRTLNDPQGALADFRKAASMDPDGQRVQSERPGFERLQAAAGHLAALAKLAAKPQTEIRKAYWSLYGGMAGPALAAARAGLASWPESAAGKILEARARTALGPSDADRAGTERMVDVGKPMESPEVLDGILDADAVLAARKDDTSARIDRAGWLTSAGQNALAHADIEAVLATSPGSIPALHLAVTISRRQGNFPAATAYAGRLEKLKAPRAVLCDVFTALGQMAFEQSNFPLALDFAERSLGIGSTPLAWELKAACHTRLGQLNEAADATKKAGRP